MSASIIQGNIYRKAPALKVPRNVECLIAIDSQLLKQELILGAFGVHASRADLPAGPKFSNQMLNYVKY